MPACAANDQPNDSICALRVPSPDSNIDPDLVPKI